MESTHPSLKRYPPPGIPHLTLNGRSTTPGVGDRIQICLLRGCICITREGRPLRFRNAYGVESDNFEFSTSFNRVTAEQFVLFLATMLGLGCEPVKAHFAQQLMFELTYHH